LQKNHGVFRTGLPPFQKKPTPAKALIKFLASPAARPEIVRAAWTRITASATN